MSIFTDDLPAQLKYAGDKWTTSLSGSGCSSFYGIFDAENKLETDGTGQIVVIAGSSLTVLTTIAQQLSYNQELTDSNGNIWYFREALMEGDGALSKCSLTSKPNV